MKLVRFIILGIVIHVSTPTLATALQKFVIGNHHAGFFSILFGALNSIYWCEQNNKIPVMFWGKETLYYVPEGYNGSTNAWEYYFEPVSSLTATAKEWRYMHYFPPERSRPLIPSQWVPDKDGRKRINEFMKKYVKIKPQVMKKIDAFYNEHMKGKKTIGIHLRGTDKPLEVRPIDPMIMLAKANELAVADDYQFLIATDEERLLALSQQTLHGKVICYDSFRSSDGLPIHTRAINKAQVGEDVLIEAQLLSRCDIFLHTKSNVSLAALLFNPELHDVYFESKYVLHLGKQYITKKMVSRVGEVLSDLPESVLRNPVNDVQI